MSDNQDGLLALADRIQEADNQPIAIDPAAASELRRLVAENEALKTELAEQARLVGMGSEREARLLAINAELVEALKDLLFWGADDVYQRSKIACDKARAALAKAEASNG